MDLQEARGLFDRYDGSRFYMSRDGVEAAYLEAGVPREVESAWLEELKQDKLRLLSQEGNWRVLHFFLHHADFGHLADFIRAEPRGMLWERCTFLELLLEYAGEVNRRGRDPSLVAQAVDKAVLEAERLLKRAKSNDSIGRIRAILLQARHLQQEIDVD
jgi:hypothetical protein